MTLKIELHGDNLPQLLRSLVYLTEDIERINSKVDNGMGSLPYKSEGYGGGYSQLVEINAT